MSLEFLMRDFSMGRSSFCSVRSQVLRADYACGVRTAPLTAGDSIAIVRARAIEYQLSTINYLSTWNFDRQLQVLI